MLGMYDWDLGEPDFNMFEALNTHAPNTPSLDFLASVPWRPAVHQYEAALEGPTSRSVERVVAPSSSPGMDGMAPSTDIPSQGRPHEIPDGQPYDSPWVGQSNVHK
jgi:hypothetical protein